MLKIGYITKSQGLKGEVKVLTSASESVWDVIDNVVVDGVSMRVLEKNFRQNGLFLRLESIITKEKADTLKNKAIFVDSDVAHKALNDGQYFIEELIGSKVLIDDKIIGVLVDIENFGATDIFVVRQPNKKEIRFPAVEDVFSNVSIVSKEISLNKKRFSEVSVYED